jgi:CubicO group peptidase (beta-lactamase class C family)
VDSSVSGHCDGAFEAVRDAFAANFAERGEVGAAVCVMVDGAVVVDLVGGCSDATGTRPWRPDTLVDFYSVGKAIVALLALQLVDAGLVELDTPIASFWPEFAGGGKASVTLRHALCHRAGVPAIRERLTNDDLWDWERMTGALVSGSACRPPALAQRAQPGARRGRVRRAVARRRLPAGRSVCRAGSRHECP